MLVLQLADELVVYQVCVRMCVSIVQKLHVFLSHMPHSQIVKCQIFSRVFLPDSGVLNVP